MLMAGPTGSTAHLQSLLVSAAPPAVLRPWQGMQPHNAGTAAVLLHAMDIMLAAFLLVVCDEVIVFSSSQAGYGDLDLLEEALTSARPICSVLKVDTQHSPAFAERSDLLT